MNKEKETTDNPMEKVQSHDWNNERLEQLKQLMPDLFTNDGQLNINELKKVVDPKNVNETERYEFRWFGKSNAKREAFTPTDATLVYDEKRSVNPAESENLIIEGENLAVLKLLSNSYREQVKCIYIDPPYNTGNDFVYSDKFNQDRKEYWEDAEMIENGLKIDTNIETEGRFHSNWLDMMYSRLLVARQLLREDGVIFISLDDNEIHHLRKLCDEVFGEDNFYSQIIVRANSRGQTYNQIAKTHEYILIYTKSIDGDLIELEKDAANSDLNLKDDIGNFNIRELRNRNPKFGKHNRPNLFYPIYANTKLADKDGFFPISLKKTDEYNVKIEPFNSKGIESCWRWGTTKFEDNVNTNTLLSNVVGKEKGDGSFGVYEKYRKTTYKPKSIWDDNAFLTETGTVEVKNLGFDGEFDFPKPVELVKRCIELTVEKGDTVLDFFAGSGTTGQSVFELNNNTDKDIKFIAIQLPEKCPESSIAFKNGFKKISDITIERNKRVVEKIIKEKKEAQPDLFSKKENDQDQLNGLGFKVFKLKKSNFPRVEYAPDPEKTEEENIEALKKYIRDKEAQLVTAFNRDELITEILIKNGFKLNYSLTKQEEFKKNEILLASDGDKETLICLDVTISDETVEHFKTHTDQKLIVLERALDTTKKWNLKHAMGDKFNAF
ncbi:MULTISPECIES: site-specific DNA-methyltransferase [Flavobacteriaceae]|uniref:site-specific DNA-methyltransferase (adenine-specific) n=2 Tax=Flagellimonas TaxID=444459 RepID=A0A371JVL5_9FLAO|nr:MULTISPECIES: site-specific DNA-methyltransferase [Flavobacteriaceae]RDY61826.1 site-specific DNA-methyltransferase [Allomuricauda nanhaiensis]THV57171.1 site-specific DNA-methyltransferase [Allomuricauda alvinocaridis]